MNTGDMHQPVRYFSLLPVEIWALCWSLCSLRQQHRLSFVCKPFRSITLPFLFKHLSFDAAVDDPGFFMDKEDLSRRLRSMHRTAVRLEKLTESPLTFAPFVQSWTVTLGYQEEYKLDTTGLSEAFHTRIYETFGKALTLCHNLSAVHLKRLKIDTMLLSTVLSLPKLQHLAIDTRELTVVDTGGVLPKNAMLRSLDLSNDYFLREGFAEIDLPILAHLTPSFINSLRGPDFPAIKGDSLPTLRALTGPPAMIISLAPNRPITRASISPSNSPAESLLHACAALSRSSVPVRTLDLPHVQYMPLILSRFDLARIDSLDELFSEITPLLPNLTELTLDVPNPHQIDPCCVECWDEEDIESEPLGVDELPILCDDTAFDDLPEHEVSDDEGDSSDLDTDIIISLDKIPDTELEVESQLHQWFMQKIYPLPLPHSIEILHLRAAWVETPLPLAAQQRALELLNTAHPTLREVQLAMPNSTRRRTGYVLTVIRSSQEASKTLVEPLSATFENRDITREFVYQKYFW
ncbi:hypothetical protein R3P38DRAFT_3275155 [Favolaschia claudopus]|uniref:F-box domain-containing protein n=1 Tax=Favolaschia claudopus TaxID=2862362 RepID=A0AAW0AVR5_9AGAR